MDKIKPVYNSKITCPVCNKEIQYTKVRSKQIRLLKQDGDFCPYYEGVNPLFHEAVICPECGYGAHITSFSSINKYDRAKIEEKITPRWQKRSFLGERDLNQAMEAFKIVLLNLYAMDAPNSEIGKICMRIAWLYRYSEDHENENKFIVHALENYKKAYAQEDLSVEGKLDQYTCIYIIGELNKRLENYEESTQWLSKLIMSFSDPRKKEKIPNRLIEATRDLYQEVKDLMATSKK